MSGDATPEGGAVGWRVVVVAGALGAATIVALLPLCDLLFNCGCDWPWSGGVDHCNVYRPGDRHCPWCVHPWTADASLAFLLGAQAFGAWALARRHRGWVAPLVGGACGGAAAAVVARAIVAWLSGYPLTAS